MKFVFALEGKKMWEKEKMQIDASFLTLRICENNIVSCRQFVVRFAWKVQKHFPGTENNSAVF